MYLSDIFIWRYRCGRTLHMKHQKIQTFTVKSSDPNFDESKLAKKVSDLYSTEHYELNINPDLRNLIPKIALSLDEPFADASIIPSFAISEEA